MQHSAIEPIVTLTEAAALEVKALLAKPENTGKILRVYIEEGGCSGMQYSMTFDEERVDDLSFEQHGVLLVVDPFSADYLRGTVMDYNDSLTNGGWKLNNPNAKQSCGCGKSFTA